MSQRFEGHNLEDALTQAATTLGVDRYQLSHRILLEKRGFLGGVKRVVIEVDVNAEPVAPAPAAPPPAAPSSAAAPSGEPQKPRASAPVASRAARPGGRGEGRMGGGGQGRGRRGEGRPREREGGARGGRRGGAGRSGERRPRQEQDLRPGDFERVAADLPEQTPQSEAALAVRQWCERAIDLSGLALTIRTEENDERIIVRLFGPDTRRLTDHHGELLDALQVLANKALVGRKAEKDIELDCEAFKERRQSNLVEQARDMAERVRRDGREQLLPVMSPIERRIIHLALRDDEDVTTESRGEGFYKRVAIIRRTAAVQPADAHRGEP